MSIKIIKLKKLFLPRYSSNSYINDLRKNGTIIGKNCYFYNPKSIYIDLMSLKFINIGNNVQLTEGVKILAHDYSYSVLVNKYNEIYRPQRRTIIGNNVFIRMNTIILMGTTIGDNVIIGAGSVVTGNIESNSVYAGNPARKICSLDYYKDKLKSQFESSAKCYYEVYGNNNMNIYKSLYEDIDDIRVNLLKNIPHGICGESIRKLKSNKKYKNMKEFLNNINN